MSEFTFMEKLDWIIISGLVILALYLYSISYTRKERIKVIISKVREYSDEIYGLTDATVVFRYGNFSKKQKELITSCFDIINEKTERLLKEIEEYSKEPDI
jgi:transcription termination factor NusB